MIKIGILTYHRAVNYGAYLQAYALCSKLNEDERFDAEIIDFNMDLENKKYSLSLKKIIKYRSLKKIFFYSKLNKTFKRALEYQKLSSKYIHCDDIEVFKKNINNNYDIIICGSDEIWKVDGFRGFPTPYWLPCDVGAIKMSYAASSRSNLKNADKNIVSEIKNILNDFSLISVRDNITYNQIVDNIKPKCDVMISPDPSLVYNYSIKDEMISEKIEKILNSDYILVMTNEKKIVKLIVEKFSSNYKIISVFDWNKGCTNLADVTPFEWIELVRNAKFVFSSYFHCICFSIKYNKKFMALGNEAKKDKLNDLLEKAECLSNFVNVDDIVSNKVDFSEKYDECCKDIDNTNFLKKCEISFDEYKKVLIKNYKETKGEKNGQ